MNNAERLTRVVPLLLAAALGLLMLTTLVNVATHTAADTLASHDSPGGVGFPSFGTDVDLGYARNGGIVAPRTDDDDPQANWRQLMNEIPPSAAALGPPPNWRQLVDEIPPSVAVVDPPANWRQLLNEIETRPSTAAGSRVRQSSTTDGGSVEYGQIALGGLAGVVIAGGAAVAFGARHRRAAPTA